MNERILEQLDSGSKPVALKGSAAHFPGDWKFKAGTWEETFVETVAIRLVALKDRKSAFNFW